MTLKVQTASNYACYNFIGGGLYFFKFFLFFSSAGIPNYVCNKENVCDAT